MEDRQRSVAQFEGELFYEPDEIPDDMDPAAAAELRQDRAVCPLLTNACGDYIVSAMI